MIDHQKNERERIKYLKYNHANDQGLDENSELLEYRSQRGSIGYMGAYERRT